MDGRHTTSQDKSKEGHEPRIAPVPSTCSLQTDPVCNIGLTNHRPHYSPIQAGRAQKLYRPRFPFLECTLIIN